MVNSGHCIEQYVPNKWTRCPRKALDLVGNKLLAFKVPLGSSYNGQIELPNRFPPSMLLNWCKAKNIKIGLWIDLTETNEYYDKCEVKSKCKYLKLPCKEQDQVPSDEETNKFIRAVDKFTSEQPRDCIGVHCTYGFNRTGYMIVSYLVERMNCSLKAALEKFAKVRPPGIYRRDYFIQLYMKYNEGGEIIPTVKVPSWYHDKNSTSTNGKDCKESTKEYISSKTPVPNSSSSVISYKEDDINSMTDVPGVQRFTDYQKMGQLQKRVHKMCDWNEIGFPGCQPVAMNINNKELLTRKPYRVSWKPEGTRYIMLIDGEDEVYLFDRGYNVFKVENLRFVHGNNLRRHLQGTLVDGEMVIDEVNGRHIPRYLIYDIIKFDDIDVSKLPFHPIRSQCIDDELISPRFKAMECGLINKTSEPFSIRKKEFWRIDQTEFLLNNFAQTLPHKFDGLIFQPTKEPYVFGSCNEVLKWNNVNSIDFKLTIGTTDGIGIMKVGYLFVGHTDRPFANIKYTDSIKYLDKKIIECKYECNEWKFMRERTDKSFPNSYETAMAVYTAISTPMTSDMLVDFIERNRFNDNADVTLPPPNKRARI